MSESAQNPRRGAPRDPALEQRRLRGTWRRAALLHDFDEVDGLQRTEERPTSGHDVDLAARATRRLLAGAGGRTARVFAIRNWSDSDKPQRGRSPEFWLLSCRIFGEEGVRADADAIAAAVEALRLLGLTARHVKVRISHRDAVRSLLMRRGVAAERLDAWFPLLHRAGKMSNDDFISGALELGMESKTALDVLRVLTMSTPFENPTTQLFLSEQAGGRGPEYFKALFAELRAMGVAEWCVLNLGIVRGGAHHTGMVFEIHDAGGRGRALAGGGRSAFEQGGTVHAVGFDMGDTALLELLHETSPAPDVLALTEELGARTDVVLAATDEPGALGAVLASAAALRRAGLRVRRLDSPLASIEELLRGAREGGRGGVRHAVLIESGTAPGVARVASVETASAPPRTVPLDRLPDFFRS